MHIILLFLIVLLKTKNLSIAQPDHWIVIWNVGQGQWVTEITANRCSHFDVGGEFGSFNRLKSSLLYHCALKKNDIRISHWDYDHFMNLPLLARSVPQLCYSYLPEIGTDKKSVQKMMALSIQKCHQETGKTSDIVEWIPHFQKKQQTNSSSAVFRTGSVLIPGDSPLSAEKKWATVLDLRSVQLLVAGHHGSKTSSGDHLLQHLPQLLMVFVSARKDKYGHPDREVLTRFALKKTPVLRTEDWGHLWISL